MGQIKGQPSNIIIGAGHSLILGNMPSKIPEKDYGNLVFGGNTEQFGFFSSVDYNTFYPGVTKEDFTPSDVDFIEPVFRMLSEVIVNKDWSPVDFGQGGVLKSSQNMMVGQTVVVDHESNVGNSIGSVKQTFWQESYKDKGIQVPAGFNGVLKIDAKANPRISRGILMDPPSIHSNSVSVAFTWDKSHPKMSDQDFYNKLGTYDEKGDLIRRVAVAIDCYRHTSLVSHGADPFAQKVNQDGSLNNPKYASQQSYSASKGTEVDYYFFDCKGFNKAVILNNTMAFNMNLGKQKHLNNNSNMTPEEKALLSTLIGTGLLQLGDGKEINPENVKAAILSLVSGNADLESQVSLLTLGKKTSDDKVITLTAEINDLKSKVEENKAMATLGTETLAEFRTQTVASFKKIHGETADENIINLINSADVKQLTSLKKGYDVELEKQFPMTCSKCGSAELTRATSKVEGEEGEDTNNGGNETKSFSDITRELAYKTNKGNSTMFKK